MKQSKFFYWGPLVMQHFLTKDELDAVKHLCHKDQRKNYKSHLAGHLEDEFQIDYNAFEKIIAKYIDEYCRMLFQWKENDKERRTHRDGYVFTAWVNYMKPGDFNPPHTHSGELSGVLFVDVPEQIHSESLNFGANGHGPGTLNITIGPPKKHWIDSYAFLPTAGEMFIFPADTPHWVAPFRSNVERVSVAFNISFKGYSSI